MCEWEYMCECASMRVSGGVCMSMRDCEYMCMTGFMCVSVCV